MKDHKKQAFGAAVAAASMLLIPAVMSAQGVMAAATRSRPSENACLRLKSTIPAPLATSREELELRKMQQQLTEFRSRAESLDPSAIQRVMMVRKEVDSLAQVFVRGAPGELGGSGTFIFRTRPGGDPPSAAERAELEMMIREMQPRVAEAVRLTVNIQSTARGYLGLTTSMDTYPTMPDLNRSFAYCEYPRVETVEPGSPADKVGLTSGDTLLAYDGRDLLRYDVHYPSLLVPGRQLRISYRRDGQIREVVPTVSQRAAQDRVMIVAGRECGEPGSPFACETPLPAMAGPRMPQGGASPVRSSIMLRSTPSQVFGIFMPGSVPGEGTLGGAKLMAISEAMQKSQNMVPGLLVLGARETLQAYAAGIREGDVIVSANGSPVRDINSLATALQPTSSEHYATLQLSSSTGLRTVTLRW